MIRNSGHCGKCESMNLEYQSQELNDNQIYYPYTCGDCGHEGKEWYILTYIETE